MWHLIVALNLMPAPPMDADRFIALMARLPVAGVEQGPDDLSSGEDFRAIMRNLENQTLTSSQFDVLVYQALTVLDNPNTPLASRNLLLHHLSNRQALGDVALPIEEHTYGMATSLRSLAARDPSVVPRLAPLLKHDSYAVRTTALVTLGACGEAASDYWSDMLDVPVRPIWGMGGDWSLEAAFLLCGDVCLPFLIDAVESGDAQAGRALAFLSVYDERAARAMQSIPWDHKLAAHHRVRANTLILVCDAPRTPTAAEIVECLTFGDEEAVGEIMRALLDWSHRHEDSALAVEVQRKLRQVGEHDVAREMRRLAPGLFPTTKPEAEGPGL